MPNDRHSGIRDEYEGGTDRRPPVVARFVTADDLQNIPPRRWLYGRLLVRGFITVLAGAGGVGKTAFAVALMVSVATRQALLGHVVHERARVWFFTLEDDRDEAHRRLKACLLRHRIDPSDVVDCIAIRTMKDGGLVVAEPGPDGDDTIVVTPDAEALKAEILAHEIGLVIVDPFLRSHHAVEISNTQMDRVMAIWSAVADETQCAVLLNHHLRKGGGAPDDADDVRGAAAIVNAARVAVKLSRMTAPEAEALQVPEGERRGYARLDNAKQNLSPAPAGADWFRLASVALGNGSEDQPDGDHMQVATAWSPPGLFDGLPMSECVAALDVIAAGLPNGERYSDNPQARGRLASEVVAAKCAIDVQRAQRIVAAWVKAGLLIVQTYAAIKRRQPVNGLFVDAAKLAAMRAEIVE